MAYWLVKSEPSKYSWETFVKDNQTIWDGVRNYAARIHLRNMKKGDSVFFYHSNEDLAIIGIATIYKEAFPDPTTDDANWVAVGLKPLRKLKRMVTLKEMKADSRLQELKLIKIGRLSVSPVTDEEWKAILSLEIN
jgi:predicted RNA-binding protein with PUA-like domain